MSCDMCTFDLLAQRTRDRTEMRSQNHLSVGGRSRYDREHAFLDVVSASVVLSSTNGYKDVLSPQLAI
jgi:hypothetical protein